MQKFGYVGRRIAAVVLEETERFDCIAVVACSEQACVLRLDF